MTLLMISDSNLNLPIGRKQLLACLIFLKPSQTRICILYFIFFIYFYSITKLPSQVQKYVMVISNNRHDSAKHRLLNADYRISRPKD